MPDRRRQRGPHPKDEDCFRAEALTTLREAVAELSWLLSRGYPKRASLELVGDRHALRDRQRRALRSCAAADDERLRRRAAEIAPHDLAGETLLVDGYNVLLTLESALSGAAVLVGRDGAYRDLASMGRHYKRVETTRPALELAVSWCLRRGCRDTVWLLDRPISNSGRLAALMRNLAREHDWPFEVRLVANPDRELVAASDIVATSDSGILDRCRRWVNLPGAVIRSRIPDAWIVDLSSVRAHPARADQT